jgi:hypothetical protein
MYSTSTAMYNTSYELWKLLAVNAEAKSEMSVFDPSILRHSGIIGTADEAVLNNVMKKMNEKIHPLNMATSQTCKK